MSIKRNINNKRKLPLPALGIVLSLLSTTVGSVYAAEQPMETSSQPFVLKLGASRLIYNPASNGATIAVSNQQDYPILVRSQVFAENKTSPAPFVVTPPLFRLDGQQQSRLRVVNTGGQMPSDRENLNWLCVTGIPPQSDDAWAADKEGKSAAPKSVSLNVQVSVQNCIKLLVRPSSIGPLADRASSLVWTRQGNALNVNNPTPFYMNLSRVTVGGANVEQLQHIAPFSSHSFTLPKGAAGQVQWQVITDAGGQSRMYQASL
ncbi:fimbria/pilus periplasmic chaperone [Yersinia ruckeri]|uniref:fimbria/pilus periplasmic chaperone n=1 Tax=Yersinia ruckeri TaxID=29486 RepID=UPI0004E33755|nr:fimbria/pilus periplasmic chaperone [Yersinia ruckeri]ARZ01098.1 chaperone protein PsaB [Yersinia ruckeri]EKN4181426.1 fimbria/pilus periplasmic chaperone [Yersinia ruckeri]KFE39095.1 molecular chaperone [Yersinia ruckeri]MCK8554114.1 fimbria/pilus periplasmic chaperone [Yersinia ruckeri]MCW6525578.1 fimbria/pilus periplasmic chaperone [Yersinia ruckeri]